MAYLKEIVTKAVIGKSKKKTSEELIIETDYNVDTVLGCWIINHTFSGRRNEHKVEVEGSYDINVWYAYDNNTKTNVLVRNFFYRDSMNVKLKSEVDKNTQEIIIRSLKAPTVSDVKIDGNKISLTIEKELGAEVVGDTIVRVNVEEDFDDYEEDIDVEEIEVKVTEDYLNGVNQK